mgnify:CR=1 FL=1
MTIGTLARQAGVSAQAFRFYERKGLLTTPPRAANGYRAYEADAAQRLAFIGTSRAAGFSLREIKRLLVISEHHSGACVEVRDELDGKIEALDRQIAALRKVRTKLKKLQKACDKNDTDCCPALGGFQSVRNSAKTFRATARVR